MRIKNSQSLYPCIGKNNVRQINLLGVQVRFFSLTIIEFHTLTKSVSPINNIKREM